MNKFWPSLHINAYKALSRGFEPTRANLKLASPEIGFVRNCLRRHDLRQIWVFVGHGPSSWSSSDMGLRHGKAFVNHGASSVMGFCHPWVFIIHMPSSKWASSDMVFIAHGPSFEIVFVRHGPSLEMVFVRNGLHQQWASSVMDFVGQSLYHKLSLSVMGFRPSWTS